MTILTREQIDARGRFGVPDLTDTALAYHDLRESVLALAQEIAADDPVTHYRSDVVSSLIQAAVASVGQVKS